MQSAFTAGGRGGSLGLSVKAGRKCKQSESSLQKRIFANRCCGGLELSVRLPRVVQDYADCQRFK
jgi:hypothetical protein